MVVIAMTLTFIGGAALLLCRKIENEDIAVWLRYLGVAGAMSNVYLWNGLPVSFRHADEIAFWSCAGTAMYILYILWLLHDLIMYERVYEDE